MDKPRRRRRKNGDGVTGPKLEVHEQPRLDNVPAAPWIGSAIDPTARGLDTMSDLALRTLANSEFAHLSPQCKSYARHRLDLLLSTKAAAQAAGIPMDEAGRVDRGAVATIQAHRDRQPTLNRSSVIESYQALYAQCEGKGPSGVAQQVKILAAITRLAGLDAAPLDLTMFDASGPAEDMARETMQHVAAGKLTPEDGQRIMGATKGASEVAINNKLANPGTDSDNPFPIGSQMHLNVETKRRQMENLDYLIQMQANKTLGIESDD